MFNNIGTTSFLGLFPKGSLVFSYGWSRLEQATMSWVPSASSTNTQHGGGRR